jgi:hypothetical protein
MPEVPPDYSVPAKKILPSLQKDKILVYVEGAKEDVDFWKRFLEEKFEGAKLEFIPRPGVGALKDYEGILEGGSTEFLVARDSDYEVLGGRQFKSALILHTHSHSLENVLLCRCKFASLLKKYQRLTRIDLSESKECFEEFNNEARQLFLLDAALRILGRSPKVLDCVIERFGTVVDNIMKFDQQKVDSFLGGIAVDVNVTSLMAKIEALGLEATNAARGHFVFSFFRRRLEDKASKKRGESVKVSNDLLYTELLEGCTRCDGGAGCVEKIRNQVEVAAKTLVPAT